MYLENWKQLTSDPHILEMIKGTKIEFEEFRPENKGFDSAHCTKPEYHDIIENEIEKLLHENVLEKAPYFRANLSRTFSLERKKTQKLDSYSLSKG